MSTGIFSWEVMRFVTPLVISPIVFLMTYAFGSSLLRSRTQRHYRRMLILYQATTQADGASWFRQVTVAPLAAALGRARVLAAAVLTMIIGMLDRRLLGGINVISRRDLTRIGLGGIVSSAVLGMVGNGDLRAIGVGLLIGMMAPIIVARRRNRRRNLIFGRQLPQILTVMITALRAGQSLAQAVETIATEIDEPARSEFLLVAQKRRLGVDFSDALKQLAERVDCADLQLLVSALVIQRETGGNLVPMLEIIYATVRERLMFQGEIRAMTAQQRLGALIVTGLPFGMFGLLYLLNPDGLSFFWTVRPIGPGLIGLALLLIVFGHLIISRLQTIG